MTLTEYPQRLLKRWLTESGARVELPDDFYSLVAATHERVEVGEEPASEAVLGLPGYLPIVLR